MENDQPTMSIMGDMTGVFALVWRELVASYSSTTNLGLLKP
jgi:hypothetical protein